MDRLFVVVLAGGSGERFWPLSTPSHPKQFPPLLDGQSFFQRTVERAVNLVGQGQVLVATRRELLPIVEQQLPGFPRANCLLEPVGRDRLSLKRFSGTRGRSIRSSVSSTMIRRNRENRSHWI